MREEKQERDRKGKEKVHWELWRAHLPPHNILWGILPCSWGWTSWRLCNEGKERASLKRCLEQHERLKKRLTAHFDVKWSSMMVFQKDQGNAMPNPVNQKGLYSKWSSVYNILQCVEFSRLGNITFSIFLSIKGTNTTPGKCQMQET